MIRASPVGIGHCQECNLGELCKRNKTRGFATHLDIDTQSQVSTSAGGVDNVKERSCKDGSKLDWALTKSMKEEPDTACPCNEIDIKQTYCRGWSQGAAITHLRASRTHLSQCLDTYLPKWILCMLGNGNECPHYWLRQWDQIRSRVSPSVTFFGYDINHSTDELDDLFSFNCMFVVAGQRPSKGSHPVLSQK